MSIIFCSENCTIAFVCSNNDEVEIEQYMDKIKKYREIHNLSESNYSNEKILEVLKENNFDFDSAYKKLIENDLS